MSIKSKLKSVVSKVKSVATKAAVGFYNTVNTVGKTIKDTITQGKGGQLVSAAYNAIPKKTSGTGGLDYSPNVATNLDGSNTYGRSDAGNNMSNKTVVGMTRYTPSYMTAAPKTTSSGSKINSKSDYSSASYGTDLTALSASNFMTGGPISTSVNASSLSSQSSPAGASSVPSAPSPRNYEGVVKGGNVGVGANPETGMMQPSVDSTTGESTTEAAPKEDATSMYQKALDKLFKQKDTQDELYARAREESGIQQAQQQMQNTQNAINGITAKMNSDLLQLRGTAAREGVTEAVYGGQQAQVTREASIQLLPLQAQLAADQGNLEMAESNLDTLFKIYSKDAEDSFNFYANQAKTIYDKANKDEQRQLDALTEQKKFEQSMVKDQANAQQSYMSQALKDGNMRLFNALKTIQPPTNINSPTYAQDRQNYIDDMNEAVGQYGEVPAKAGQGVLASLPVSIQNRVIGLADDLKSSDIVKKFNSTADSINVVNGIAPDSKNPADHQQIVYAFAKALDPDSAVREGEYATIKKYAQGAVSRYGKEISNAINGTGFLSAEAIKNIQATMNSTYNSRKPLYENLIKEKSRIINNIAGADVASELIVNYQGGVSETGNNDPLGIF